MDIFKLIFDLVKDWKSLKDARDHTVFDFVTDEAFEVYVHNNETDKIGKAETSTTTKFKNDLLEYINQKNLNM